MSAPAASSPRLRLPPSAARRRWAVASRAFAAVGGGYALASLTSVVLALASRAPREDAIVAATTPAFLVFAGAILWAFAASTAVRAWLGIAVPGLVLAGVITWLRTTASP